MSIGDFRKRETRRNSRAAFSLLEVMIAIGIFFMVAFAVLALVSQSLSQARSLQLIRSPLGSLAAQTVVTNELAEGIETGDFGDIFPQYSWTREVMEVGTNGLYEVLLTVSRSGHKDAEMSLFVFQPQTGLGRRPGGRPRR